MLLRSFFSPGERASLSAFRILRLLPLAVFFVSFISAAYADGDADAQSFDEVLAELHEETIDEMAQSMGVGSGTIVYDDSQAVDMSLSSMVMFALDDNPDVGMALAREDQAKYNTGRAKAALYPAINLTLQEGYEYNNPAAGKNPVGGLTTQSDRVALVLEQLIFDGGFTKNTVNQRKQAEKSADIDVELNTQDVLTETVRQYLNVMRYQSTLKDAQGFINRLSGIVDTINTTYELGGSAKSDVDYAQSRLSAAESATESVRSSLNDSISNLEYLTGPLPAFRANAPDELDPERIKLDEYFQLAEENNPDSRLNQSDLQMMKYKLKSDKGVYMPRVSFIMSGEKTYDDGGRSGRDLNGKAYLAMSYNIFDGFEARENIKRTKAMISEIEIKQEKILKDLKKQVKLSYNQLVSLQNNISKTKAEISSSTALQELNQQNFEQGNISLIVLIEGEERLYGALGKLHQQEADLYMSAYKLLIDVGVLKKNFFCSEC